MALLGAGAIAMSPVAVPQDGTPTSAAIQLAAATDWPDIFAEAGQNAAALFNSWLQAPAPVLQQIIANQLRYLSQLPDFAGIGGQIQVNAQRAFGALLVADPGTLDATHRTLYTLLPAVQQIPGIPALLHFNISATGQQLLAFSTTALSGVLLGLAGPVLGPLVALQSSLASIAADVSAQTPDLAGALSTLVNIPAAMTDAFLNGGQHVDLTALVRAIGPSIGVTFPDGVQAGAALGGLLSPGGSIFNALDLAYDNDLLGVLHIHVPLATGTGVGPIGAMMDLARSIATAIGWNGAVNTSARTALAAANEIPPSVTDSAATVNVRVTDATGQGTNGRSGADVSARRSISARNSLSDKAVASSSAARDSHRDTARPAGADRLKSSAASAGKPSAARSARTARAAAG
ncbi:hypothetical protein B1R94_05735 [Mycolicibacterium litorale]|nr:hypothetical protein B1R94_05735 [Mycolicibacterium litorale]